MIKFILKEVHKNKWTILAPKGHQILEPQRFRSKGEAIEFCRSYLSSFPPNTFDVQELNKEIKE